MERFRRIKAFYMMESEELEATEERAGEIFNSDPAGQEDAFSELESVAFEREFRESDDQTKIKGDLGRYLFDIDLENRFDDLVGTEYEDRIQEAAEDVRFVDSLVAAAIRDIEHLSKEEVEQRFGISPGYTGLMGKAIGIREVPGQEEIDEAVEGIRSKYGEEDAELAREYARKVPGASSREVMPALEYSSTDPDFDISLKDWANIYSVRTDKADNALEYLQEKRN